MVFLLQNNPTAPLLLTIGSLEARLFVGTGIGLIPMVEKGTMQENPEGFGKYNTYMSIWTGATNSQAKICTK